MDSTGRKSPAHAIAGVLLCVLSLDLFQPSALGAHRAFVQPGPQGPVTLEVEHLATLRDGDHAVLGQPRWIDVDPRGRYVVGDRSDRSIKVYDANGERLLTIGETGQGPGESTRLTTNALAGDSILGYDLAMGRLNVFSLDGAYDRMLRFASGMPPFTVRAIDDNHLLLVQHPSRPGGLLKIARLSDGSVLREFFALPQRWSAIPEVLPHTVIFADGYEGLVVAGMFGSDTLRFFDIQGMLLGQSRIDVREPVDAYDRLLEGKDGQLRDAGGDWFHHQARLLLNVVALADSSAAVHVATYDARLGTDILEGGTIIVLRLTDGEVAEVGRIETSWGLLGRDSDGRALVMRYSPGSADDHEVGRIVVDIDR